MKTDKHQIKIISCRGETVFDIQLNSDDAKLIQRLAKISQKVSKSECQPTLSIKKVTRIVVKNT